MKVWNLRIGATTLALLAALAATAPAPAQSFFNNWGRCTDVRLLPERRVDYCTRLLNNGGGPNSEIEVLTVLGGLYRDMHQYAKAIDAYTRALNYEALGVSDEHRSTEAPGSTISIPTAGVLTSALEGRAEVYAITGQTNLAMADIAHIFRLEPDAATSYATSCRIRAIMKSDLDKALADCNQASKLDPKNTQVLGAVGLLQYRLGHLKEASADFDEILAASPKLAGALFMRGVIENRTGNSAAGSADIATATAEDPVIAAGFSDFGITP